MFKYILYGFALQSELTQLPMLYFKNKLKTENMKTILKLNHFLFHWYYKRCGDHFRQWTFLTSVKLLISNYEHRNLLFNNQLEHNIALIKDNDNLRKTISDLKIKQIATDGQIDWVNKSFGANIHKDSEN